MRLRLLTTLTLITVLVATSMFLHGGTTAKTNASTTQSKPQPKRKQILPDLPGTVSGAANPEAIPDIVAFELFMRSIADYPSENVFKDVGLRGDQVRNALNYVQSFELAMSLFDRDARKIKRSRSGTDRLAQLQQKKEEYLERGLKHYLPMILGAEAGNKIRSYINARVKPKTKNLRATSAETYVYCKAWYDDENVYGAGTISTNYSDVNQYRVTTTVIAPDGSRYSTSESGWDYVVTDTEYLPILPNDGTFTVEAVFEGSDGYLASATATQDVQAQVRLSSVTMIPNSGGQASLVVRVETTQSVPPGTAATLEANEVNSGGIIYSINPPSRKLNFLLQGGGKTDVQTFMFVVGNEQSPLGGTIQTTVFLGSTITAGAPRNADASLVVAPVSPSPSPPALGSGRVL